MSSASVVRRLVQQCPKAARSLQTSRSVKGGDHHGGGPYDFDFIHAEHMYQPWNMKHRELKFGGAILGMLAFGFGVPCFAVWWQQKRARGG